MILNQRQFFHGTDADLTGAEHVEPGHGGGEASRFFGGARGSSRVYVATTPEGAARYGKNVYRVTPKKGARGLPDPAGTHMYRQEGHAEIEAHSFKSPMRIEHQVHGATYSRVVPDRERLQNLQWLKANGHEVSPEGEEFLKRHSR